MQAWWLKFTDGSEACCEGQSAYDAKMIAEKLTGKKVAGPEWRDFSAQTLPYAATPVIWQLDHPVSGKAWTLCHSPKQCAGKTACPQRRACSE